MGRDSTELPRGFHNQGELELVKTYRLWQYFGSLTFAGVIPSSSQAVRLVFAHLYRCARLLSIPYSSLIWVLRSEHGELGGREHYHLLLSGGRISQPTLGMAFTMNHLWSELPRCGFARHRLYDPKRHGVEYIVSCLTDSDATGKNQYELSKFLLSGCDVMLSHSLLRSVAGQSVGGSPSMRVHVDRVRNRERGKKRAANTPISRRWSNRDYGVFSYSEVDARLADNDAGKGIGPDLAQHVEVLHGKTGEQQSARRSGTAGGCGAKV